MSWLARSLGQFGSDIGAGHDIALDWRQREQQMALENARQKIAEAMLPLQIQEIQTRLKQMGQPKEIGLTGLPGGGTAGVTFDPTNARFATQPLIPGMDKNAVKAQIAKMAQGVQSKEAKATLQAYADSIDAGEDPQAALQKALAFMGTSSTHADVSGRVKSGEYIPDPQSITGVSRLQKDGMGNVVGKTPNVIMPGMTPKVTEGWVSSFTTGENGEIIPILVPKTTVTTPQVPGLSQTKPHAAAGGIPQAPPAQGGPTLPRGSRVIGEKPGDVQKDAIKASKDARDAASVLNVAKGDYRDAKAGNPKASLALVFGAVRSMVAGAGRMTNVEIEQELKAGSLEQRLERWYQQAATGTMPADQMDQIMAVIQNAYEGKRQSGEQAWRYAFPNKPLQPWLKPPEQSAPAITNTPPPGAKIRDYSQLGSKP